MEKQCFKCLLYKPLTDFYKHSGMSDGYLNKCKDCAKSDVRKHRRENDSVREYDRNRTSRNTTEKSRSYKKRNPEKYKAHTIVSNAIRDGKLEKGLICETCEIDTKLHAHHDDYSKPLQIRWLCPRCHALFHSEHGEF